MTELAVVTGVGGLAAVGFVAWQIGLASSAGVQSATDSRAGGTLRDAGTRPSSTRVARLATP